MNYYDDQKKLIATSVDELKVYFRSLPGCSVCQEMPYTLPLPLTAILQVQSTAPLPKYLYAGNLSPANRIYPQKKAQNTLFLDSLLNGRDNYNSIPIPSLGNIESHTVVVPVPVLGVIQSYSADTHIVGVTPLGGWALNSVYTSAVSALGVVTLNISVINSSITVPTSFVSEEIVRLDINGRPTTPVLIFGGTNPNLLPASSLLVAVPGGVFYTGNQISVSGAGAIIEFFSIQYSIS